MLDRKIAVIGMGYVGIPAAVLLADAGFDVTGLQRRSKRSGWKIEYLNEGKCPIGGDEPELPEMIERNVKSGRFRVTDNFSVLGDMDIILIDVQTPTDKDHIPRYESLKEVSNIVGRYLKPGKLVIIESTVAPGTTEFMVKPILEEVSGLKAGLPDGFGLSFSYERVMVGRLIHNIREYPKIVGAVDEESRRIAIDMYSKIVVGGVHGTDPMTSEIAKTVENAYRDVQIAFANEVALLCESLGVDVYDVRKFVNGLPNDPSQPHANPVRNMHYPGGGVGGHCLPKDTWLLFHGYNEYGKEKFEYRPSILAGSRHLNDWMPVHMVELLEEVFSEKKIDTAGSRVGVLGFAFLQDSDDSRNTPTVQLMDELTKKGIEFIIHDPFDYKDDDVKVVHDLDSMMNDLDAIIIMTKHREYLDLDPDSLLRRMKNKIIIDGRNTIDPEIFIEKGFSVRGIGKGQLRRHA